MTASSTTRIALKEDIQSFFLNIYGKDKFELICKRLSVPPPTTIRVNTLKTTPEKLCDQLRDVSKKQARQRGVSLEELEKLKIYVHPEIKDVIQLDILGPFDRQTQGLPIACVDSFCGEAVRQ